MYYIEKFSWLATIFRAYTFIFDIVAFVGIIYNITLMGVYRSIIDKNSIGQPETNKKLNKIDKFAKIERTIFYTCLIIWIALFGLCWFCTGKPFGR